ncbi:uncharacterized protein LOC115037799 [Echeneis naucrates]|uniref:uncharacterized protein LOC115037799 n=1 Tax=Echeneis naucrates TaxID=173247 RepID=UPI0011139922|nr:uncharacterized protein LOC115037799 [Echeneis naucrates]
MMADFRWIQTAVFLLLELQFCAVTGQQHISSVIVRVGQDASLSCESFRDGDKCDGTSWILHSSTFTGYLVQNGKISEQKHKSDRLSLTETCSLALKTVSAKDAGRYDCVHKKSNEQREDSFVHLSVVSITEQSVEGHNAENVQLSCSVLVCPNHQRSVKWLFEGKNVEEDMKTSEPSCSATVRVPSSYLTNTKLIQCEVTDNYNKSVFPFKAPPPGGRKGDKLDKHTTPPTKRKDDNTTTLSEMFSTESWLYVAVAVPAAVLLVAVAVLIHYRRRKGKEWVGPGDTENTNQGLSLNSAGTQSGPEPSRDTADPDVSYASVSYIRKSSSPAQVPYRDDEGEAVTYSTLKVSPFAGEAFTDPNVVYAPVQ